MQRIKVYIKASVIVSILSFPLFVISTAVGQKNRNCEEEFKVINRIYNEGDWSTTRNASLNFINHFKNSEYCRDNISRVYNYLIQSYLRLYNLDSAKSHYFDALENEYKINLDSTDEQIFKQSAKLKKHSLNFYMGIISSDIREIKLGVGYGITSRLFIETSVNNWHFSHGSEIGNGVFGKPLIQDPKKIPTYIYRISGYDRYFDLASYIKTPVFVSQKDVNVFYVSVGCFASYYLNSHVNSWNLIRYDDPDNRSVKSEAYLEYLKNKRYVQIDTLGVHMDLKKLYQNRLNYGLFMNLGSSIRMKNRWELFFEIKFAASRNNRYRYKEFSSYKPGQDYFFLVVGVTKKFYKIIEKKKIRCIPSMHPAFSYQTKPNRFLLLPISR